MTTLKEIILNFIGFFKLILIGIIPLLISCAVLGVIARLCWTVFMFGFKLLPF